MVEGVAVMTLDHVTAQQESLADYAVLLAEGAAVLSALAATPTATARAEELSDLRAIHDEGAELGQETPAAECLARMFAAMVRAGSELSGQTETPPATQQRIAHFQHLTQSLAIALDEPSDASILQKLNGDLQALDPGSDLAVDMDAAISLAAEVTVRVL